MAQVSFTLNGKSEVVSVDDPAMPLLYALRNQMELHGPRYGCGLGQCGACTVHIDGQAARSCLIPVSSVANKSVTTLEGLAQGNTLHALQKAFIDEQALQCGYCTNGMIMQAADLLKRKPNPTEGEVRQALDANLCRCGSHVRIVRAVLRASGQIQA